MILQSAHGYPQVGERLANFYPMWSDLKNDSWVLQAISGYKIKFIHEPFQTGDLIPVINLTPLNESLFSIIILSRRG